MKIKSKQVYTVEFTEEQWRCIDSLIRNLHEDHLLSLGCTPSYAGELWAILVGMRQELLK